MTRYIAITQEEEVAVARAALFSRHPSMQLWPPHHGFFFCKLNITNILLLNYFGGAKTVLVEDYFAVQL